MERAKGERNLLIGVNPQGTDSFPRDVANQLRHYGAEMGRWSSRFSREDITYPLAPLYPPFSFVESY